VNDYKKNHIIWRKEKQTDLFKKKKKTLHTKLVVEIPFSRDTSKLTDRKVGCVLQTSVGPVLCGCTLKTKQNKIN
jgi:hypothetical protein